MPPSHVLIVDDNRGIRLGVRLYLEGCGFSVLEAADCASALALLADRVFDLAVLDYSLPDGTALELLERGRVLQPGMKVVVLTAYPSPKLADEARVRGAARFLTKPVDLAHLRQVLDELSEDETLGRLGQAADR